MVTLTNMFDFQIFDTKYHRRERYRLFSEISFKDADWDHLLHNPDPEVNYMYEFNYDISAGIQCIESNLLIPVITEHVEYNGYSINRNTKKFWKDSYIFAFIRLDSMLFQKKFGHYLPVYQSQNIPVFARYSFDCYDGKIFTSFSADSLIYVRDSKGALTHAIGFQAPGMSKEYPPTKSYDDYALFTRTQLKICGYYTDLKVINGYVFRSYRREKESGYGMQIYRDNDLIGDVLMGAPLKIIGAYNGYFYAVLPVDLENERYIILKFRL